SLPAYAAEQITVAADGKSTFTSVIPAQKHESLTHAAREMQVDIQLATVAILAIKNDSDVDSYSAVIISLGATSQATAAGVSAANLSDEAYRIITKNGNLYIIGPDTAEGQYTKNGGFSTGTSNGVYSFLEKHLGVRWLMPGDLGRD